MPLPLQAKQALDLVPMPELPRPLQYGQGALPLPKQASQR